MGRKKSMLTEEEKKAKYKTYQKGYQKTYKLSDEQKAEKKVYMDKYNPKYKKDNKEQLAAYDKEYKAKRKDGLNYVYLLKDEHYIGVTDCLVNRFDKHRHDGRNTDNYRIMYTTPDRAKALEIETQYHGMGFFGANN